MQKTFLPQSKKALYPLFTLLASPDHFLKVPKQMYNLIQHMSMFLSQIVEHFPELLRGLCFKLQK